MLKHYFRSCYDGQYIANQSDPTIITMPTVGQKKIYARTNVISFFNRSVPFILTGLD